MHDARAYHLGCNLAITDLSISDWITRCSGARIGQVRDKGALATSGIIVVLERRPSTWTSRSGISNIRNLSLDYRAEPRRRYPPRLGSRYELPVTEGARPSWPPGCHFVPEDDPICRRDTSMPENCRSSIVPNITETNHPCHVHYARSGGRAHTVLRTLARPIAFLDTQHQHPTSESWSSRLPPGSTLPLGMLTRVWFSSSTVRQVNVRQHLLSTALTTSPGVAAVRAFSRTSFDVHTNPYSLGYAKHHLRSSRPR